MVFNAVLNCLTNIFLKSDTGNVYGLLSNALYIFGMWGIFRKCGLQPWRSLIPCLREAAEGEAAGVEKEGRILAFLMQQRQQGRLRICKRRRYRIRMRWLRMGCKRRTFF